MARRKDVRSNVQYKAAHELEKLGELPGAIKGYQKAVATDPANIQAWNRQMILFRKSKTRLQEIALIKSAIAAYKKSIETSHQQWLYENREKAESSLELATVLGLIEPNGTPKAEHAILEKWETRLYLLEYRQKNARPKKSKTTKKPIDKISTKIKKIVAKPKLKPAKRPGPNTITNTKLPKTKK